MDRIRDLPGVLAFVVLFVVVFLRAGGTYLLGRAAMRAGHATRWRGKLSGPRMARARELSSRFGVFAVPLSFLTIGVQTAANFSAGLTRMPARRYVPALLVGCVIWAAIYAGLFTLLLDLSER